MLQPLVCGSEVGGSHAQASVCCAKRRLRVAPADAGAVPAHRRASPTVKVLRGMATSHGGKLTVASPLHPGPPTGGPSPHQRKADAGARLGMVLIDAVEGREDALAFLLGHPRPPVADRQLPAPVVCGQVDLHRTVGRVAALAQQRREVVDVDGRGGACSGEPFDVQQVVGRRTQPPCSASSRASTRCGSPAMSSGPSPVMRSIPSLTTRSCVWVSASILYSSRPVTATKSSPLPTSTRSASQSRCRARGSTIGEVPRIQLVATMT